MHLALRSLLACCAAVAAAGSALAGANPPLPAHNADLKLAHNCQCYAKGRRFAQGAITCVGGQRLQCGMSLNVSSWKILPGACRPDQVSETGPSPLWPGLRQAGTFPVSTWPFTPM